MVTKVSEAVPFWVAEAEHQDYLQRYPAGYNCHFPRPGWKLPTARPPPSGMSSPAEDGGQSLSNVGLPRTDWESLFWTLFAAYENPMVIADADRQIVSGNGALQRLLSRAEEELVGRSIVKLEVGDRVSAVVKAMRAGLIR